MDLGWIRRTQNRRSAYEYCGWPRIPGAEKAAARPHGAATRWPPRGRMARQPAGRRAAAWRGNPLAAAFAGVAGLAVAAAVVIAVLLGGRIAELEDRTGRARDRTTEQVAVLEALAMGRGNAVRLVGTENAPEAVGFLLMTSDERVAVLVCSGLERMPSGKAYQLWLNRADTKMSGGLVNADYYGFALLVVRSPEPISRFQTFGMTIEPEGGSAGPTGAKVMGGGFQ